jgi:hypothetical protein
MPPEHSQPLSQALSVAFSGASLLSFLFDAVVNSEVHPMDWTGSPRSVILGSGQKGEKDVSPETQVFRRV